MKMIKVLFSFSFLLMALFGFLFGKQTALAGQTATSNEADLSPLPAIDLPQDRISAISRLYVQDFALEGNKIFSDAELRDLIKDFVGREITAEELQEVRTILSKHYIDQGYINSGAIIPDQAIQTTQIITLRIIEGRLKDINLLNAHDIQLKENYIKQRLKLSETEALNTDILQERLQILQQNPLIKRFHAELGPGIQAGEAVLNLAIAENRPYDINFSLNNHRSPSVGSIRGEISAHHRNLTGWGDSLYGRLGLTQGLLDYNLNYKIPISRYDSTLELKAEHSDSEVVAEPFSQLDITSKASTYGLTVRHPFYKAYSKDFHYRVLDMGLGLEKRRSDTQLLGQPFAFPPVVDPVNKVTALRLSQNWLDRSRDQVIAFASTFGFGIDALGATIHDGIHQETGAAAVEPDSDFIVWLGQFRWINRLPLPWDKETDSQLWLRADLQYSNDPLLPLEKFAMGGHSTVRGYRENQLTRDTGAVLSLEWQIPVAQWQIPKLSKENEGQVLLAPFIDYGWGDNNDLEAPKPNYLASLGLGVIWNASQQARAQLYWGYRLKKVEKPEESDLQDHGIHFSLELSL